MRIGLLTYYWENNSGQYFQALATVEALRTVFPGATVEIPDVRHWDTHYRASIKDRFLRPNRYAQHVLRLKRYDEARKLLPIAGPTVSTPDPAAAVAEIARRGYDLLVVGADTTLFTWGDNRFTDNLPPLYWLHGLDDGTPRAMMSACSHTDRYDRLNETQRRIMREALQRFSFITVRDPFTKDLLDRLGPPEGVDVRVLCDPTLSYRIDPAPATAVWYKTQRKGDKPICGLRLPYRSPFTEELARRLVAQYEVFDLSGGYRGATPLVGLGPLEWSGIFGKFDLFVTTSFHETIFALKQGTAVYTIEGAPYRFDVETGKSKVVFLHEAFGTLGRQFFNPYLDPVPAQQVFEHIRDTWQSFDGQSAIDTGAELGEQYMQAMRQMREVVLPLVEARGQGAAS